MYPIGAKGQPTNTHFLAQGENMDVLSLMNKTNKQKISNGYVNEFVHKGSNVGIYYSKYGKEWDWWCEVLLQHTYPKSSKGKFEWNFKALVTLRKCWFFLSTIEFVDEFSMIFASQHSTLSSPCFSLNYQPFCLIKATVCTPFLIIYPTSLCSLLESLSRKL